MEINFEEAGLAPAPETGAPRVAAAGEAAGADPQRQRAVSGPSVETEQLERRRVGELRPHPQAAEVPTLSEAEYLTLRDDVAARGVFVPLEVTAGGTLLDGRARLRAAREL